MVATAFKTSVHFRFDRVLVGLILAVIAVMAVPQAANAIPLFNRQTGQNCVACHAGGQFPELTPYGRLFKMTGYTIGERTLPVSAMVVVSSSSVARRTGSDDPGADFSKNSSLIVPTASLFLGGKISDNIGAFTQITVDRYAGPNADGKYYSQSNADNIDLRFADRFIDSQRDLIVGLSLNNNPSLADPWNTAAAWMQYVPVPSPSSSRFIDGNTPYPGYASGGNIAGLTAYAFWNQTIYAELGAYRTAKGLMSFMSAGLHDVDITRLRGLNPYWRLALNQAWGANSLMLGGSGMVSRIYDDPLNTGDPATIHHFTDVGVDAQYQYLLDPHAVTAQLVATRQRHRYPDMLANLGVDFVDASGNSLAPTNSSDTMRLIRARLSYVWQARYGGSASVFSLTGTTNTANQSSGFDPATLTITSDPAASVASTRVGGNLSGNPATRGSTLELFWTPIQYMRIGGQYTAYSRYNGAARNYDGFGRNASDNNSLFLYVWAAY